MNESHGPVPRTFFARPAEVVAPELLGCVLVADSADGTVALRLTEVEAYAGEQDPGSHAYRGRTPRTIVMFGPPGHVYVYFSYGMHWCMNLVCEPDGTAAAVLLRAGEVIDGIGLATARRGDRVRGRDLARGPARLTQALGVDRALNGADLLDAESGLRLLPGQPPDKIMSGPRTGVGGAGADTPWRFWSDGEPTVSAYRPHAPRRRGPAARTPD